MENLIDCRRRGQNPQKRHCRCGEWKAALGWMKPDSSVLVILKIFTIVQDLLNIGQRKLKIVNQLQILCSASPNLRTMSPLLSVYFQLQFILNHNAAKTFRHSKKERVMMEGKAKSPEATMLSKGFSTYDNYYVYHKCVATMVPLSHSYNSSKITSNGLCE